MGLAASQARFLGLTARKSNTEYQGQQVNQQRTSLANESAGLFNQMMSLAVPTPPSVSDYYADTYTYGTVGDYKIITNWEAKGGADDGYTIYFTDGTGNITTGDAQSVVQNASGFLTKVTYDVSDVAEYKENGTRVGYTLTYTDGRSFTLLDTDLEENADGTKIDPTVGSEAYQKTIAVSYAKSKDDAAYEMATNQYNIEKSIYEQKYNEINAKTEKVQVQDRSLELRLKQLDTDERAISTELEAVKKVIEKNIEQTFKTFA